MIHPSQSDSHTLTHTHSHTTHTHTHKYSQEDRSIIMKRPIQCRLYSHCTKVTQSSQLVISNDSCAIIHLSTCLSIIAIQIHSSYCHLLLTICPISSLQFETELSQCNASLGCCQLKFNVRYQLKQFVHATIVCLLETGYNF